VQYPFWPSSSDLAGPSTKLTTRVAPDIRLSTAAFISARFPWITPAASVPIRDEVTGETVKVRLVDGGYSDNSGVETAMDLMERLSIGADGYISFREAETADDLPLPPRARVSLIALTGGDFPVRTSFAFGELMEPIRAMLNVRQSRAYAAISRAAQLYPPTWAGQFDYEGQATIVKVDTVRLVVLDNPYYALPLGWALSDRSREIIAKLSGRFRDCFMDVAMRQSTEGLSQADCVQVVVHDELTQSLKEDAATVATLAALRGVGAGQAPPPRLNAEAFIRCYRDTSLPAMNLRQKAILEALLDEWSRRTDIEDVRLWALALGVLDENSNRFRLLSENLNYASAAMLRRVWGSRMFKSLEDAQPYVHNPELLANKVYGTRLGNTEPGDGWKYRGRGMLQLTGKSWYQRSSPQPIDLVNQPDLMLAPAIDAKVAFNFVFSAANLPRLRQSFADGNEDWGKAAKLFQPSPARVANIVERARAIQPCVVAAAQ
jgi:predicted chitinase